METSSKASSGSVRICLSKTSYDICASACHCSTEQYFLPSEKRGTNFCLVAPGVKAGFKQEFFAPLRQKPSKNKTLMPARTQSRPPNGFPCYNHADLRKTTDEKNYFSNGIFWNHIILRFNRQWLGHWGYRNAHVVIVPRFSCDRGTIDPQSWYDS